jgi:hypothetical protein
MYMDWTEEKTATVCKQRATLRETGIHTDTRDRVKTAPRHHTVIAVKCPTNAGHMQPPVHEAATPRAFAALAAKHAHSQRRRRSIDAKSIVLCTMMICVFLIVRMMVARSSAARSGRPTYCPDASAKRSERGRSAGGSSSWLAAALPSLLLLPLCVLLLVFVDADGCRSEATATDAAAGASRTSIESKFIVDAAASATSGDRADILTA